MEANDRAAGRRFSIAEANALLPRLERQLRRVRTLLRRAEALRREALALERVGVLPSGAPILSADVRRARRAHEDLCAEATGLLEAIAATGCQIRDVRAGLVDFPARLDGQDVLLCWKVGETAIAYYHSEEDGDQGRRPLPGAG